MGRIRFGRRRRSEGAIAAAGGAVAAVLAAAILAAQALAAEPPPVWTATAPADSGHHLTAVTCSSLTLCVGIDMQGDAITSATPASNIGWTLDSAAGLTPPSPAPSDVACVQGSFCIAGETAGRIATAANPASGPWTAVLIDGAHTINGVSCPTATLCFAVDNNGGLLSSANPTGGTAAWPAAQMLDGTTALSAISCPTATFCAAVDASGNVLTSTTPQTVPWSTTPLTSHALVDISCNNATACVAIDGAGNVYATASAGTPPVTWSTTPIDPSHHPTAVACTDGGLCALVDDAGVAYSSDTFTLARPTWTPATIDAMGLTGISCNVAGFCVAVDSAGATVAGVSPMPVPTTGTGTASDQTDATLTASVDPGDAVLAGCQFEYGTSTAYGASVPCTSIPVANGGAQAVSAAIGGLAAGTTYHFRIDAATAVTSQVGADATFVTPAPLKPNPSLSGTPAVGSTLTCKTNVTLTAAEVAAYQWLSDTVAIPSANAATYVVAPTDATHHLSCQVTISGDGGSASATSGFDAIPSGTGAKATESVAGTAKDSSGTVKVPVTCSPQAAVSCTFTLTLTTMETVKHKRKAVTIGSSKATLALGATKTLSVSLSAAGRSLLAKKHTLAITFTVKGTLIGTLVAPLQTDKYTFSTSTSKKKHKKAARHATHRHR